MTENLQIKGWLPKIGAFQHDQLELAKWLALTTMVIDHSGKVGLHEAFWATHLVGRVSFPLFAWIIGCRLAMNSNLGFSYLKWLVPFALISQPVYIFAGRDIFEGNILFTMALGVAAVLAYEKIGRRVHLLAAFLLIGLASYFVEYGFVGVLLILMTAIVSRVDIIRALLLFGVGAVAANITWDSWPHTAAGLAALLSVPLILFSFKVNWQLPRAPKWLFYVFYPSHLLLLTWAAIYLAAP